MHVSASSPPFDALLLAWRRRALTLLYWAVLVPRTYQGLHYFASETWAPPFVVPDLVFVLLYLLLLAGTIARSLPHMVRGWLIFALGYAAQAVGMAMGARFNSQIPFVLLVTPISCGILLGRASARVATGLSLALLAVMGLLVKYDLGPVHPIPVHPRSILDLIVPLMVVFVPALVLHDRYTALLTRLLHRERALRTHLQREAEQRTFLERALLESSERERQAVGHELHDGVCQQITAAMLHCRAMEQSVRGGSDAPPERSPALSKLHTILTILDQSLGQAHDLAQGLSPGALPADGLLPALRDLARRTRETCDAACEVDLQPCPVALDPVAVNHLYRVAQEAVANAVKHGPARWIRVRLVAGSGQLVLEVDNDGRAPLAGNGTGMGLRIMRYRCGLIGASLELVPRPEGGAQLRCTLPLAVPERMAAPEPARLRERSSPAGMAV